MARLRGFVVLSTLSWLVRMLNFLVFLKNLIYCGDMTFLQAFCPYNIGYFQHSVVRLC